MFAIMATLKSLSKMYDLMQTMFICPFCFLCEKYKMNPETRKTTNDPVAKQCPALKDLL